MDQSRTDQSGLDQSGASLEPRNVPPRRWSDLWTRVLSALILAAVAITTAREGGMLFILVWLLGGIAILWEWQRLIGAPHFGWRMGLGTLALGIAAFSTQRLALDGGLLVLLVAAGLMAALAGRGKRVWAASGLLYAGLLVIAVAALRFSFPFGARSIIWLFATVWATDCFAYFGGRLIGGPKLLPRLSPSKTWSGTITGILLGGAIGTLVSVRDLPEPHRILPILILSFAAAALSQAGDAFESGIKRHFNIKDSSHLIPGHGGFMDRLDGFIAAAIFACAVGVVRNGPSVAGGLFYWA